MFDVKQISEVATEAIVIADVKSHLYITHSDDDIYLTALITKARKDIEFITSIAVGSQEKIWWDDLVGGCRYKIPHGPVITVDVVKIEIGDGDFVPLTNIDDYKVINETLYCYRTGLYKIEYTTGYEPVPANLKQAILCQVAYLYEHRGEGGLPGISKEAFDLSKAYKDHSWT